MPNIISHHNITQYAGYTNDLSHYFLTRLFLLKEPDGTAPKLVGLTDSVRVNTAIGLFFLFLENILLINLPILDRFFLLLQLASHYQLMNLP